jgi:hypothetical protein
VFAATYRNSEHKAACPSYVPKVDILTQTGNAHRKMGLMIRQTMETNSAYADIILHADGLLSIRAIVLPDH